MKTRTAAILTAVMGFGTLLEAGTVTQIAQAQTPPVMQRQKHGERHPELRAALRHLTASRTALQHAAHDFGGHREKALDLTNQAISETQQALQDDKH